MRAELATALFLRKSPTTKGGSDAYRMHILMKVAFATDLPPPFMLLIDSINNKLLKMPEYGLFSGDNEELEESNKHGFWYVGHVESVVLIQRKDI